MPALHGKTGWSTDDAVLFLFWRNSGNGLRQRLKPSPATGNRLEACWSIARNVLLQDNELTPVHVHESIPVLIR